MLRFVQSWFAPRANPIGVDFGSDCLRLAQVQWVGNEYQLIAAASADVPPALRQDPAQRLAWFIATGRDLLAQGSFRGRMAVLGLPAAWMHIQHLRLPRMDEAALTKALPWEARGKLPIDPANALMRHLVAGDIYHDQEPKSEVIVMAAGRELVNQFLAAAGRARLDVVGMNVEPKVIVDCFGQIYRRKSDGEVARCFIDIGASATRAVIARGAEILFARSIPIGGDQFTQAVAAELKIGFDDARLLRIKLACLQPALDEHRERQVLTARPTAPPAPLPAAEPLPPPAEGESFALLTAGLQASARRSGSAAGDRPAPSPPPAPSFTPQITQDDAPATQAMRVERAVRPSLNKLIEELDLCRRYYEATFPANPVERLIFVGGEARQRGLCQQIARELGLTAQVGDPLVRMGRISDVAATSGIDRRQPQPGWAVAIGLSMGSEAIARAEDGATGDGARGGEEVSPAPAAAESNN
jgi:type IV pilus assembly protein PilM